ncbi:MAG: DUF59 domain-containing protein [Spirochaetes bacterium]|nr:DUF59 domain-containing protein [Spirochaetota bacterium]
MSIKEQVAIAAGKVMDPELMLSMDELGLIYGVKEEDGRFIIEMTLTTPACPLGPVLANQVKQEALKVDGVKDVEVKLVFSPAWNPRTMASEKAKLMLGLL